VLPFDDIMKLVLALLAVTPAELETLGWPSPSASRCSTISSHRGARRRACRSTIWTFPIELALLQRDLTGSSGSRVASCPKSATNAAMFDPTAALGPASHRRAQCRIWRIAIHA
jgi:hypothetical protein